jgi:broad specificity phosphatase PhoE
MLLIHSLDSVKHFGAYYKAMPSRQLTRILVARHGETLTNRQGVFCGHSETELTDRGRLQAQALANRLAHEEIAAVYTSGLGRAVETARIATASREIPFYTEAGLREIHYGEWELQKERSVAHRYPGQHKLMRAEDPAWQPPGGETTGMVRERTFAAIRRIARAHRHHTVLVVSHGTAVQCLLAELLGMAPTHTFRIEIANCGLSVISEVRGHMVALSINETSFLDALDTTTPGAPGRPPP